MTEGTLSDLKPDPKNARRRTPRSLGMIVDSLHQVGAARSIVVDEDNNILAGNGTIDAAAEAGIERVQFVEADGETIIAVRRSGLTSEQKKKLALFDNRTAELAEWDADVLADIAGELDLKDLWNDDELAGLLGNVSAPLLTDPDEIPDSIETRCKYGDLWRLGEHRLLCGDCTKAGDVGRLMEGENVGCVLTDPPYQMGKEMANDALDDGDFTSLHKEFFAVLPLADKATIVCFHSPRTFPVALDEGRCAGLKFERMLYMTKPNDITFPWRGWLLKSEAILVFSIGGGSWKDVHPYTADTYLFNHSGGEIMDGGSKERPVPLFHPSIKPMVVVSDLMSRLDGVVVFDPFLGSGTTLIAAEQLGRKCYGLEIEPHYCDVILQRWENATGKQAELIEHGPTPTKD